MKSVMSIRPLAAPGSRGRSRRGGRSQDRGRNSSAATSRIRPSTGTGLRTRSSGSLRTGSRSPAPSSAPGHGAEQRVADGEPAQERHGGALAHLPLVRTVDGPDRAGEADHEGGRHEGDRRRCHDDRDGVEVVQWGFRLGSSGRSRPSSIRTVRGSLPSRSTPCRRPCGGRGCRGRPARLPSA